VGVGSSSSSSSSSSWGTLGLCAAVRMHKTFRGSQKTALNDRSSLTLAGLRAQVYSMFAVSNPLHASVFPSVRQMEAEVVAMTAHMLGGGGAANPDVCGSMTSGRPWSQGIRAHTHTHN